MRSIVTLITAAAFGLHSLFGCGAHHAHAIETVACLSDAEAMHHSHDGNGHDSPGASGQSPVDSESQCPQRQCNDCECVFMAAGKTEVATAAFMAVLSLSLEEKFPSDLTSSLTAAAIDSGGRIKLPVRIHLFHQVLLI